MPSFFPLNTTPGSMEVIDAYWRKRKQRIEKMLEEFQKTGWKTGGFTIRNCDGLRKRLYHDSKKYSQKISELDRTILESYTDGTSSMGGLSSPRKNSYPVIPDIKNRADRRSSIDDSEGSEDMSNTIMSEPSKYNDVFRRSGADITYIRQYERENNVVVVRNRHLDGNAKVGSLENFNHQPGGGNFEVLHQPLRLKQVKSKIGSLDNSKHIPKGGKKKIPQNSIDWKAESKIGSLDNIYHQPTGGGTSPVFHESLQWKAQAKVGSLDNIDHIPGRSFRTLQDYMSPFRKRLLEKPGVIWTEGYNQKVLNPKNGNKLTKHVKFSQTR